MNEFGCYRLLREKMLRLLSYFMHLTFDSRTYCGGLVNSTFRSRLRAASKIFSTFGSVEKQLKSSTYIPKYSGAEPGIMVPKYKHGVFGDG